MYGIKLKKLKKKIKLKQIEKKITNVSLNKKIIEFVNWFSTYNITPKGMILKMCLGNLKSFEEKKEKKNNLQQYRKNRIHIKQ